MTTNQDRSEFRIEWDLREFGERHVPAPLHGPRDPAKLAFARALATGDVPANAPQIEHEEAA
jgi:hypothetical protein